MILIASGADASANPIGHVEVPIIWDSDAAAYRAATPVAASAANYAKSKALNNFFKGVKTAGLWTKISHMYLPVFGQAEGGVDLKNPASNIGFPASNATYNAQGVNFSLAWAMPYSLNTSDIHVGAFNTTAPPDNTDIIRVSIGQSSSNFQLGRRIQATRQAGILYNAGLARLSVTDHMLSIGPMIAVNKASTPMTAVQIDSEYVSNPQTYAGGVVTLNLSGTSAGANTNNPNQVFGFYTFGTFLTQAEMATYGALQTTLMTALLAA